MRESRAAYRERISGLSSVEPSLMQMISNKSVDCASRLSRQQASQGAVLYTAMMTESGISASARADIFSLNCFEMPGICKYPAIFRRASP